MDFKDRTYDIIRSLTELDPQSDWIVRWDDEDSCWVARNIGSDFITGDELQLLQSFGRVVRISYEGPLQNSEMIIEISPSGGQGATGDAPSDSL